MKVGNNVGDSVGLASLVGKFVGVYVGANVMEEDGANGVNVGFSDVIIELGVRDTTGQMHDGLCDGLPVGDGAN